MTDNRNTILAVILSGLVLIAWQYFYNVPQMERQRAQTQTQTELAKSSTSAPPGSTTPGSSTPQPGAAPSPATPGQPAAAAPIESRDKVIAGSSRIKIETPRVTGSISLKGARIDDLSLVQYRDTVDPNSPAIVLFSPSNTAHPYYAEFGWVPASGSTARIPDQNTVWQQEGSGTLSPSNPVTLKYDNGEGLTFRRTIAIDDRFLFTIKDDVTNVGSAPVTLYPFALISRHGKPEVSGYYILHEGLIGYLGEQGLQEYAYSKIDEAKSVAFNVTNGWLGITDKYWATALLPDTTAKLQARFSSNLANKSYESMAKMKSVQPQLAALKERYPDDRQKQQQEMMEIYRKEKINPIAGCLPIALQIPVFFSLYKVLFITIEMRHAPFYGWIKDLSAHDPTNLFNLFGLLPFDPTHIPVIGFYLALGVWPIIMGITMWFQMKLNPTPPDPTQKMIFDWMPLIFTFMLAGFPAGLVIYWAWNNLLSVLQQSYIMHKNGVKVELFDNIKATFTRKAAEKT